MLFDDDRWKLVHNSLPPLRWVANAMGSWGGYHILQCSFAEEEGREKMAKFHGMMYSILMPISTKYGSFYMLQGDEFDE